MKYLFLSSALLLAACSGGGSGSSPAPTPSTSICNNAVNGWIFCYGDAVSFNSGLSFNFPSDSGGVHYVYKPATAALGQTVTLKFTLTGTGTFGVSDATDTLPASVSLFLWEKGDNLSCAGNYEYYRQFASHTPITSPGTYTITAPLTAFAVPATTPPTAIWTDCYGKTDTGQFANLLSNLAYVGFTFGGADFDGHGAYAKSGTITFTLNSFTIQ